MMVSVWMILWLLMPRRIIRCEEKFLISGTELGTTKKSSLRRSSSEMSIVGLVIGKFLMAIPLS